MTRWLRLWFGVSQKVGRVEYAASGFGLMLFKYGVEALVLWNTTGIFFSPLTFLTPLIASRESLIQSGPAWLLPVWMLWTLPFVWIAVSMSVRRAADAGHSPWAGLLVLAPIVNLIVMGLFCLEPSAPGEHWAPRNPALRCEPALIHPFVSLGASLLIGVVMLVLGVFVFATYGGSLFVGTPLVMGAAAAYLDNCAAPNSYRRAIGLGTLAVFLPLVLLMAFALEGAVCIVMAFPLIAPLGAVGGAIGKAIADATRRPTSDLLGVVLVLPLLAGGEAYVAHCDERVVLTTVEIDAPPEIVWNEVVSFPDLTDPPEWYYKLGVACPLRARIEGSGVGATRYCEFTTGTFVEPITAWEPAQRLAFDVREQPEPLFELSPYGHIHPPHLTGYLQSKRGEFRLIELAGNRTRLEGRTWYTLAMYPQGYWTFWTDELIHRIHQRVLAHIKGLSEKARATAG